MKQSKRIQANNLEEVDAPVNNVTSTGAEYFFSHKSIRSGQNLPAFWHSIKNGSIGKPRSCEVTLKSERPRPPSGRTYSSQGKLLQCY